MTLNVYLFLLWDAIFICAPKSKKKNFIYTKTSVKSHNNTFVNNCKFM